MGVEEICRKIWERRVREGKPCQQGCCQRTECSTCQVQEVMWRQWCQVMGWH